ncbi:hypothetical protein AL473_07245 [Klebsiella quasipneumoniae]|nr:hypothetical protein AL473_07245 [Klebsiella quasipneumoniae]AWO60936.1 hypothetical protein DLJ73_07740 [Klebsiella quasipneumoniae subsp. similipneumoniae]
MLKKTALSCAASPFAAVLYRDGHQPPSSHNPATPTPPASHPPSTPALPNPTQTYLKFFSPHSHLHPYNNPSPPKQIPQYPLPNYSPQPHPPPFPYIPESFSQCLFVIHPLRSKILISSIFL